MRSCCSACGKTGHNRRSCSVERVILRAGPTLVSIHPPPLSGVRVEASVRLDVEAMRRHLAPDQIAAVMTGIGRCLSLSAEAQPWPVHKPCPSS